MNRLRQKGIGDGPQAQAIRERVPRVKFPDTRVAVRRRACADIVSRVDGQRTPAARRPCPGNRSPVLVTGGTQISRSAATGLYAHP